MIETSPTKYDLDKLKRKMEEINPLYTDRRRPKKKTDELYYKYNVLYGSSTNRLIKTYSPKMRPVSSSIKTFRETMTASKSDECRVFNETEIDALLQAKTKDLGIEYREEMRDKFSQYCRKKCINRRVNFAECFVGFHFISALSPILQSSDKIAYLDLTQNSLGDIGVKILCDAIQSSASLVMLNLTSNSISHKGGERVFAMLLSHSSIISINLSSTEGVNRNRLCAEGLKDIANVLQSNSFLEELNIGGNSIKSEGLKLLSEGMANNSRLHYLNISNNEISSLGIQSHFTQIKCSRVIELNLSSNPLKNDGVKKITDSLSNFSLLKKLDLSYCEMDFNGFYYLVANLQNIKRLEALNVSGNDLRTDRFNSIKQPFLQCGFKSLSMSKCNLGDKAGFTLGSCICVNDSIKKLELKANKLSDKAFRSFIPLPKSNATLESLDMSNNFLSDHTSIGFIRNLPGNKTMKHINFYGNQLKNESATSLIDVLLENKSLTNVNLVMNRVQLKLIEEINKMLNDNVKRIKRRFVPSTIQQIKEMQFKPDEIDFLRQKIVEEERTTRVLLKKLKEDTELFKQLKEEDKLEQERIGIKNEEIRDSVRALDEELKTVINEIKLNARDGVKEKERLNKAIEDATQLLLEQKKVNEGEIKERNEVILEYQVALNQMAQKNKFALEKASLSKISLNSMRNDLKKKGEQLIGLEKQQAEGLEPRSMSRKSSKGGISPRGNTGSPSRRKSLMMKKSTKVVNKESTLKLTGLSPEIGEKKKVSSKSKSKGKGTLKTKKGKRNEGRGVLDDSNKEHTLKLFTSGKIPKPVKLGLNNKKAMPVTPNLNLVHTTIESTKQTEPNVLSTFNSG